MGDRRSEKWSIFLDDGSQIFDDEELLDAEMVQGKLLTIAHSFVEFEEPSLTVNRYSPEIKKEEQHKFSDVKTEIKKEEKDKKFSPGSEEITWGHSSSDDDTGYLFLNFCFGFLVLDINLCTIYYNMRNTSILDNYVSEESSQNVEEQKNEIDKCQGKMREYCLDKIITGKIGLYG